MNENKEKIKPQIQKFPLLSLFQLQQHQQATLKCCEIKKKNRIE